MKPKVRVDVIFDGMCGRCLTAKEKAKIRRIALEAKKKIEKNAHDALNDIEKVICDTNENG